jgi:hypothetical protein
LVRVKNMLARRPETALLVVEYRKVVLEPRTTAERVAQFLGEGLDVARMAAAIDPALHRNHADSSFH